MLPTETYDIDRGASVGVPREDLVVGLMGARPVQSRDWRRFARQDSQTLSSRLHD